MVNRPRVDVMLTLAQPPGVSEAEVFDYCKDATLAAEDYGYDGVWMIEHHFSCYGLNPNGITLSSHLLGMTERIRVGTAITVLPLYDPVRVAEEVAMLDHLSGGRFDLGIGRGQSVHDFDVFGVDMNTNHITLREKMDTILQCWQPELLPIPDSGDGVTGVSVRPHPITQPHPPVYVASNDSDIMAWAARRGFPLIMRGDFDDATKREWIIEYNKYRDPPDRMIPFGPPVDHMFAIPVTIDDGDGAAITASRNFLRWWGSEGRKDNGLAANAHRIHNYKRYMEAVAKGHRVGKTDDFFRKQEELSLVGTPARCRQRLAELAVDVLGVNHLALGFEANPPEQRRTQMRRFMDEVIQPTFAAAGVC